MKVYLKGHPIQLMFRYVERAVSKKIVQPGLLVQLRSYGEPGTTRIVYGESLRFVDSRDKIDKVRARREGLIAALDSACDDWGWGRAERLAVWRVYQRQARTVGYERFAGVKDMEKGEDSGVPSPFEVLEALSREIAKQSI